MAKVVKVSLPPLQRVCDDDMRACRQPDTDKTICKLARQPMHAHTAAGAAYTPTPPRPQVKDVTVKKMKGLEEAREAVESERDALKATVAALSRDVEAAKRDAAAERRRLDELAAERDVLDRLRTQVGCLHCALCMHARACCFACRASCCKLLLRPPRLPARPHAPLLPCAGRLCDTEAGRPAAHDRGHQAQHGAGAGVVQVRP